LALLAIRAVTVAPGIVDAPTLAGLPAAAPESLGHQVPSTSRPGRPEELAQLPYHIVENNLLTGEVIRLNRALHMAPR
ncbi:MAG: family NAD(P)-dependent oxidoreductase, partial [Chloroflexi bacterium]|nr:family NAD(P)-dependent oxidoreductase [Chloroflexota bacterium]